MLFFRLLVIFVAVVPIVSFQANEVSLPVILILFWLFAKFFPPIQFLCLLVIVSHIAYLLFVVNCTYDD